MIRYAISEEELRAGIQVTSPTWLDRAAAATATLLQQGAFSQIGPNWSDIKPVYMTVQHNKCAYCERLLPPEDVGRLEHDVEHFRPKSRVIRWPPSGAQLSYPFETGAQDDDGYYWLAYEPLNYCTACKACNSNRKRDHFPVAGPRGPKHGTPAQLQAERPLLIYPLGDLDDDPETILGFSGILPVVRGQDEHRRQRGEVVIDFFGLDWREELLRQRFAVIDRMLLHLEAREMGSRARRQRAEARLTEMTADDAEHANCARSFLRLFEQDPLLAYDLYDAAAGILGELRDER